MSRLRLAVVGCGDIAQAVGWFARLNRRIQLAAACDVSADRAAAYAQRFHISRIYVDYAAMLASEVLDAIYLAVPHHLHYSMLQMALAARVPVLVEKPVTRTLPEGRSIARVAAVTGFKVGVNYQYRYDSGCHRLARAVQNGSLGPVHAVRINVPWHREEGYFAQAAWHSKIATAGGGTLLTQASHLIDIALWALAEDPPQTAAGYMEQRKFKTFTTKEQDGQGQVIEVEDLAQGIVRMESGALIQICSSMVASSEQSGSLEVYGEKGTAVYRSLPLPHVRFRDVRVKAQKPPYRGMHALQRSLEAFRAWIADDIPYLIPAREALPALAVVEAIYRSAETGMREQVN